MWASFSCPRIWTRLWWIWGCFPTLVPCCTRRTASWMCLTGTWSDAPGRSKATELRRRLARGRGPACPHGLSSGTAAAPLRDPVAAPSAQHLPFQMAPAPPVQGPEGRPGPAAAGQARGEAEGSPVKFIKHLKWIMARPMDQVLERNCTLKCKDENKDKRTRRGVVIRPCQL